MSQFDKDILARFPISGIGLITHDERIVWRMAIARSALAPIAQAHALPAWKIEEQLGNVHAQAVDLIRGGMLAPVSILRELNLRHNETQDDYETEKRN